MSCPYKYVLGIPGQGVHTSRIFGYALFDSVATIFAALITAFFTNTSVFFSLIIWFVLGEVLHYVFGVQTAVLTTLGIEACPDLKNEMIKPAYN
jgi:hypothetical protein